MVYCSKLIILQYYNLYIYIYIFVNLTFNNISKQDMIKHSNQHDMIAGSCLTWSVILTVDPFYQFMVDQTLHNNH